jgi:signal transduction histidine kinase/ActR/RegA family two-component response regulator
MLEFRSPAFVVTNREGRVVDKGGDLSRYGLEDLRAGEGAAERAYFFEGLLPLDGASSVLSRVETLAGAFADIYLFPVEDGDCALLLDASAEVAERAQIEQALRATQEHLRQAEKMEALGQLAGGIAHDLNNLLTVILGYSEMLSGMLTVDRARSAAREITQAAERAAALTKHLLSFSRRQIRRLETLDLNTVVSELQPMLRRLIGEDIVLTAILDSPLASVEADRGQIEQILVNLAANARDAMPRGGRLVIRTRNVFVDEAYIARHVGTRLRHGSHVSLSVGDSGCGMDAETRARVFEPFFTSKEPGRGTGLGLSIVYGIVTQSGGEIVLTSEVGKGSQFEILLPAVDKAPAAKCAAADQRPARGTETVLVVDDDAAVRNLIREVLTELGYFVLESAEPSAAVALCERYSAGIDLLVTDFIMPQMNGRELAARVVAAHPETRVLYVSGYAKDSFAKRGIELPGGVFLDKPFTPKLLADRVREALCQSGGV